jgi:predicted nuclease of predicted toxin-antitoxin system
MKLLLDENIHIKLKYRLLERGLDVFTVTEKKWNSKQNGELLQLMIEEGFTHLLTFDSKLSFQQNFAKYPIPVIAIIAPSNSYKILMEMFEEIVQTIQTAMIGANVVVYQTKTD